MVLKTILSFIFSFFAFFWYEICWLSLFGLPNFTLRWVVYLYYSNLAYSYFFLFLNRLVITLTVESIVVYRYFLTFQFISFLTSEVIFMVYHGIRRFFVDVRYRIYCASPRIFIEVCYIGLLIFGYTTGIFWEIGKWKTYLSQVKKFIVAKLLDWTTVFYYTFSINMYSILNAVYQTRELRYLRSKPKFFKFFTLDELYFGCAGVYRLIKSLALVRLQDMYIPEIVELGYPLSWGPKGQLVRSVYDAGSYFFWAAHSQLDKTLVPLLQKYHFIPYELLTTQQTPTAHLQAILDWIAVVRKTGEITEKHDLFLDELLNEIYFAFHDHFRLVVLEHIQTDPFFLIRLFCSDKFRTFVEKPGFDYYYNADETYQQILFPVDYVLDLRILERVCEHWQFVKYADEAHARLVSPYPSEMLIFSSQKKKPRILASGEATTNMTVFAEQRTFWQLFDENWTYYIHSYIEYIAYQFHFCFPTRYIIGNMLQNKEPYFDNLGWAFPIHSLQGVPYQDTFLFPCIIFYTFVSALYIYNVASNAVYDPLIYHHWFIEFNLKCQYLLGIDDLTNPEFTESIYWLSIMTIIPYYWIPNQRPYYRRRFRTYCDIEYMRYIRRTARVYQSVDPADSLQVDYFTWQFFEAMSPLFPIRDKEAMANFHKKKYRHRLTFHSPMPFGYHNPGKNYKIWQERYRKYARHLLTHGLGFLEQDWMFSYFRWEYTLQRYHAIPSVPMNDRYSHPEFLREYFRYLEMYVPWKRPESVNYPRREKRSDFRLLTSTLWRAGLWKKNEVRSISERVRPVAKTQIQKQVEYKKMVDKALNEMFNPPKPPQIEVKVQPQTKLSVEKRFFRLRSVPTQFWIRFGWRKLDPVAKYEKIPFHATFERYEERSNPVPKVSLTQVEQTPQRWVDSLVSPRHSLSIEEYRKLFKSNGPDPLKQFYPFPKFEEEQNEIRQEKYSIQGDRIVSVKYGEIPKSIYCFFHVVKCLPPILQVGPVDGAIADDECEISRISALLEMVEVAKFNDYVHRNNAAFLKNLWFTKSEKEWDEQRSPKQKSSKDLMPYLFTAPTFSARNYKQSDINPLLEVTNNVRTRKKERTLEMIRSIKVVNKLVDKYDDIVRRHKKRLPLFVIVWDPATINIRFVVDKKGILEELYRREDLEFAKFVKKYAFVPRKLLNDVNLTFFTEDVICPPFGSEDLNDNLDLRILHKRRGIQLSVGHLVWDTLLDPDTTDTNHISSDKHKSFIAQNASFVVKTIPVKQVYYTLPGIWKRILNYFIYHPLARMRSRARFFVRRSIKQAYRQYSSSFVFKYFPSFTINRGQNLEVTLKPQKYEETQRMYLRRNGWIHSAIIMDGYEWNSVYDSFMEAMHGSASSMHQRNCNLKYYEKGLPQKQLAAELDTDEGWLDDLFLFRNHTIDLRLRNRNDWHTGFLRPEITQDNLMQCLFYQPIRAFAIPAHVFESTKDQQLIALQDWYDFDNHFLDQKTMISDLGRGSLNLQHTGDYWAEDDLDQPTSFLHIPLTSLHINKGAPGEMMFSWHYLEKLRNYDVTQPLTQELFIALLNPLRTERIANWNPIDTDSELRRVSLKEKPHTRARPSLSMIKGQLPRPQDLPVNSPLALWEQTNTKLYENQVGDYMQHRINRQTQQALGNAYWRLVEEWSSPKNKKDFSFRFWLRLTPDLEQYFNLHRDRVRFLRDKNLSFSAVTYERYENARLADWSGFRDLSRKVRGVNTFRTTQWQKFQNKFNLITFKKPDKPTGSLVRVDASGNLRHPMQTVYKQMYLRYFAPGAFWESYFAREYSAEKNTLKTPSQTVPAGKLMHIYEAIEHIKDPSERLDLVFKLMEKHQISQDHPAMMDFFFNDLSQTIEAYIRECPKFTEEDNLIASSLPGTIISPREIQHYWANYKEFNHKTVKLVTFYNYLREATGTQIHEIPYSSYNINKPVSFSQNTFYIPPRLNITESMGGYSFNIDETQLTDWNKWSWLFGCAGLVESEQIAFYLFGWIPLRTQLAAGAKAWKAWKARSAKPVTKVDVPTVTQDTLTADLEQFPLLKTFDEKLVPYSEYSASIMSVPGLEHDYLVDPQISRTVYPFPTGYLRTNGTFDEDRTTQEYIKYTTGLKTNRKAVQKSIARGDYHYQQRLIRMKNYFDKHDAVEGASNPIIFADTPDNFAEYSSKEYIFDIEQQRIQNRYAWRLETEFKPHFQKYLRDNKTRRVFLHKHFSYFFDMIRKDWLYVTITPSMADEIMKELLLPELDMLRQTMKNKTVKCGIKDLTTPQLHSYRTAYIFDVIPSLVETYETKEISRRQAEAKLLEEIELVKEKYKGRYYTQLRETMLEPLTDRLEWLENDRFVETQKKFWRDGSYTWESRILGDWFVVRDTLNEIETRDPFDQYVTGFGCNLTPLAFLQFIDFDVTLYGMGYQNVANYGPSLDYWQHYTNAFYQDFETRPDTFSVRRNSFSPYGDTRCTTYFVWWEPENIEASKVLERIEPLTLLDFPNQTSIRFLNRGSLGDTMLERMRFTLALANYTSFYGQFRWFPAIDISPHLLRDAMMDMENATFRIEYFIPPNYWFPWYSTADTLSTMKSDFLLVGLYNVTQLAPTPIQFFTQVRTGGYGGIFDAYGIHCAASKGLAPFEWYDLYDPITNRVIEVLPNFNFIFKEGKRFRRYFGYYMPQTMWERISGPWSIVDNIESITSGYTDLESRVGVELAITQTLFQYFGVLPHQVIEFLTYATYWGYTWVHAIYNGSFVESHIEKLNMMTPQDGLLEIGLTGKEYDACLRNMQLKILTHPDIDYDKIFADLLRAQELKICNTYFFGYFPYRKP